MKTNEENPRGRKRRQRGTRSGLHRNAVVDSRHSLSSQVYDLLREAIVSLRFKPGDPVSEKVIAEQLKLSRTPVREAIIKLADQGLVTVVPQSGTFVSPIRLADVYQGQFVRESLEMAIIRRAAKYYNDEFDATFTELVEAQRRCAEWNDFEGFAALDEEFHQMLAQCARMPGVWRIVAAAKVQLDRVRRLGLPQPGQLDRLVNEHASILEGLREHDEEASAAALKAHLDTVLNNIKQHMARHASLFEDGALEE